MMSCQSCWQPEAADNECGFCGRPICTHCRAQWHCPCLDRKPPSVDTVQTGQSDYQEMGNPVG